MKIDSGQSTRDKRKQELGASQNLLLGVLAALIALLGYLYFFTDVIKQRDVQQAPPVASAQKVKQPIPPRPAGDETKSAAAVPQQNDKPQTVPAPAPVAAVKPPPVATPPAAPQPVAAQKSSAPTQSPAAPAAKAVAVEQKALKQASVKPETVQAKQVVPQPVKPQDKPEPAPKSAEAKPVKTKTAPASRYMITTAGIVSSKKAASMLSEMKTAGFEKIEKKQLTEEKAMKRIFAGDFGDSASAATELDKLKKVAPGAFLVTESNKYVLYAGSYDQQGRAESEMKRLAAQGLDVSIRTVNLKMPVTRISASTADKSRVDTFVQRLKSSGIGSNVKQVEK